MCFRKFFQQGVDRPCMEIVEAGDPNNITFLIKGENEGDEVSMFVVPVEELTNIGEPSRDLLDFKVEIDPPEPV